MGISPFQFQQMLAATERNKRQGRLADTEAPELESELADEIRRYCAAQWPRWKIISARTDKRSTIEPGAQDLTVFFPPGRVLCLELKSKTGKRSEAQLSWAAEMKMCGHSVYCIRTMQEFLDLVRDSSPATPQRPSASPLPLQE